MVVRSEMPGKKMGPTRGPWQPPSLRLQTFSVLAISIRKGDLSVRENEALLACVGPKRRDGVVDLGRKVDAVSAFGGHVVLANRGRDIHEAGLAAGEADTTEATNPLAQHFGGWAGTHTWPTVLAERFCEKRVSKCGGIRQRVALPTSTSLCGSAATRGTSAKNAVENFMLVVEVELGDAGGRR
jgi:hypothetical protein